MYMGNLQQLRRGMRLAGISLVAVFAMVFVAPAHAAPFTHNFDALIADLQGRAAAVSNSTDKAEQKQFKTIQKLLSTFNKASSSEDTDVKTLGSVGKTLPKSFPADFTPPGGSLSTNLLLAVGGFTNDVQVLINTAGSNINALADSSCKTKAQSTLSDAQEFLDQVNTASSVATQAKLLASSLKDTEKAGAAAVKCSASSGGGGGHGGGGSGDFVHATISGDFSASFVNRIPPTCSFTPFETTHTMLTINAGDDSSGGLGIVLAVEDPTTNGTYSVFFSSDLTRTTPSAAYSDLAGEGSVNFTTLDIPGQKLVGTFHYTCTIVVGTGSSVTVTNGSFSISTITSIGF